MMKTWDRSLLLIFFSCFIFSETIAQGCDYFKLIKEGKIKFDNKNYRGAINDYFAAIDCSNRPPLEGPEDLIKAAQDAWVAELEREKARALDAEAKAKYEKDLAEKAQKAEAIQKQRAEENARIAERNEIIARQQGKKAEGLRLALLADNERNKSQQTNALVLSYLALQLLDKSNQLEVERSFGTAVADSFSQIIRQLPKPVNDTQVFTNQDILMVLGTNQIETLSLKTLEIRTLQVAQKDQMKGLIAPDGNTILSYYPDGTIDLLDSNGLLKKHLDTEQDSILSVVYAPNSNFFLTCSRDNSAKLWNAQGEFLASLNGHKGNVYGAQFSSDCKHILTRSSDGTVKLWKIDGSLLSTIEPQSIYVYAASFTPDGKHILTCGADASLKLWNFNAEQLASMEGHRAPIVRTIFSPNQTQIASLSLDQTLKIWDNQGRFQSEIPYVPNTPISFSPNNELLASTNKNGRIMIWNTSSKLLYTLDGHRKAITSLQFSPNGHYLLSTAKDGTSRLWSIDGRSLMELDLNNTLDPLPSIFSTNGEYILYFKNNNSSLVKCPIPQVVNNQLNQTPELIKANINQLKQKYQIQFWE